eukprot:GFYU01003178.1.p1 GENE.GFYU01003178.1~~GFYU01003178.1.p1  ORF type:complete len:147 (-),score=20.10 GFYU01003178.1:84-461(-)
MEKSTIIQAFLTAIGLLMFILACALPGLWWPLFSILFLIFAGVTGGLVAKTANNYSISSTGTWANFWKFWTGFFGFSALAFPIVLVHLEEIEPLAVGLSVAGMFFFCLIPFASGSGSSDNTGGFM